MARPADYEFYKEIAKLYTALMNQEDENEQMILDMCKKLEKGPLQPVSIHKGTALHVASFYEKKNLVLKLLDQIGENNRISGLTIQNDVGNTVLHDAAVSDQMVEAARKMLCLAPELLVHRNYNDETALFCAVRFGKIEMFNFLEKEIQGRKVKMEEDKWESIYWREDGTTVLHIAVLYEHFDLAREIAQKHQELVNLEDGDKITALQLLAHNSSAFRSGRKQGWIKRRLYDCISSHGDAHSKEKSDKSWWRIPLLDEIRREKRRHESALKLAKFLIDRDVSWMETFPETDYVKLKTHGYGASSSREKRRHESALKLAKFLIDRDVSWMETFTETDYVKLKTQGYGASSSSSGDPKAEIIQGDKPAVLSPFEAQNAELIKKNKPATPIILAVRSGIKEIVEEIIKVHPQAAEHIDRHGRSILHIAVKYHKMDIFYFLLKEMEQPLRLRLRKLDSEGNSLLHLVGIRADTETAKKMGSPLIALQEDLVYLENIKKFTNHLINHRNHNGKTAEELFAETYENLRINATDWLKRTAENCSIVAVLVATVAFAAAYTVPGGPNQETGYPILEHHKFFVSFTFTDVLSLAFALTSLITFLSILTSPFRLRDFMSPLPQKLMLGVTLLMLSVSMMMLAFASTVILMIQDRHRWTRIAVYIAVLLPVSIFVLSYAPMYKSLLEAFISTLKIIGYYLPQFNFKCCSCLKKASKDDEPKNTDASPNSQAHPV